MSIRLRNDRNTDQTLALNPRAWQSALESAGNHGWMPMGTVRPELLAGFSYYELEEHSEDHNRLASGLALGGYSPRTDRMVLLEDALNLADALERAFIEREPGLINPERIIVLSDWEARAEDLHPGVGLMLALVEFCRRGSFWIERH